MRAKRVLFLGTTGVDRGAALDRLNGWYDENLRYSWKIINFEKEFLWPSGRQTGVERIRFLNGDLRYQADKWREAWERLTQALASHSFDSQGLFLSMHGTFIREFYGARCVVDIRRVAEDFQPDLVVTLISDVYDMWWRTQKRAGKHKYQGRPTLEQLIFGRRQELIVGDQIALGCDDRVRNLMFSTNHLCSTLARCIDYPQEHKTVYLSFPISQPRELEDAGDLTARERISGFIRRANETANQKTIVLNPLAIDEIPLIQKSVLYDDPSTGEKCVHFDRGLRWDLDEFSSERERLGVPPDDRSLIPIHQLDNARGNIITDVTWRDYRLVDQSDCLFVFNPIFKNRGHDAGSNKAVMARSVKREIIHALNQEKTVYLFQDPEDDPDGRVSVELDIDSGATMDEPPSSSFIVKLDTEAELLEALQRL